MVTSNDCPCKGCTERSITCHSICNAYKDWVAQNEKRKEKIRIENEIQAAVNAGFRRCGSKKYNNQT